MGDVYSLIVFPEGSRECGGGDEAIIKSGLVLLVRNDLTSNSWPFTWRISIGFCLGVEVLPVPLLSCINDRRPEYF